MRDPYQVLGVPKTASEKEIKSAFRKLAKKFLTPTRTRTTHRPRLNLPRPMRLMKLSATRKSGRSLTPVKSMQKARNASRDFPAVVPLAVLAGAVADLPLVRVSLPVPKTY